MDCLFCSNLGQGILLWLANELRIVWQRSARLGLMDVQMILNSSLRIESETAEFSAFGERTVTKFEFRSK